MLGGELALEIRVLAKHGKGVREIAREVGVSRNTVRRYLRDAEAARYRARPPRPGKLAPFEGYIAERVASAAPERLEATVLLRELRERGVSVRGRLRPWRLDAAHVASGRRFQGASSPMRLIGWSAMRSRSTRR
jgi:transposase